MHLQPHSQDAYGDAHYDTHNPVLNLIRRHHTVLRHQVPGRIGRIGYLPSLQLHFLLDWRAVAAALIPRYTSTA